ncbi:MAG: primosomal protein N' [Alphaproteobacteria bacterium]
MICEILLPKPIEKTFYYKTSEFLETGTVVKVEFKSKKVVGVVIKTHKEKIYNRPLKSVDNILSSTPLPNEILKSTEFIAKYTCNSRALILKLFLTGFERNSSIKLEKNLCDSPKKLELSSEQKKAVKSLKELGNKFKVAVLHGVTGSGKTRVFMSLVKEKLLNGFQCLILVPEIILTSEWVKEIEKDFNISPIIYHSSVNKKKREEICKSVFNKDINFIIGTRSALTLPFANLGVIIIDEEHDNSYKQNKQLILNFRDFAIVRARNSNCNIILSSATPSIETFLNVKTKKYEIVRLKKRVNKNVLPTIKILDSRKQKGLISDKLQQEIKSNISNNLQTLLFLNKRGYAPFVICKKCGVTKTCNNCSSSLTLHEFAEKKKSYLLCHYCNHKEYFVDSCKSCNLTNSLIFPGYGVEKVFEEVSNLFPKAKISLLSSDKVKNKSLSKEIKDIKENKVQIVIGTQIISKGHNFPFLRTVGILNIDSILNDFDFRSSEKAFQQITQVAGRAGRKDLKGEVFIQTYQPNHPVIKSSISSDYEWFINYELNERRNNFLPPFSSFISIIINSVNENKAKNYGLNLRNLIKEAFPNIILFGPSPSIIFKQNKIFRYRMLFKLKKNLKSGIIFKNFLTNIVTPNGIKIYIDVDPINFT